MRLYKLLIKLPQKGSIFIEKIDTEVLNVIYPIYQGNTVLIIMGVNIYNI